MIDLEKRERNVFRTLSQSGEGEVLYNYLTRMEQSVLGELIDDKSATLEDVKGARIAREIIGDFKDRLIARDIISTGIDDIS